VCKIIQSLVHFVVENERTARRFLKRVDPNIQIDALKFSVLDKDTPAAQKSVMLNPLLEGHHVGILSEAGCPGIADPGADLVEMAHLKNIHVVPLVGPSSILLAMMASGMNGQSFAFNGYLPVKKNEKDEAIRRFELRSIKERQSQVFIEAPYRNIQLFDDLVAVLKPATRLCVACDITLDTELIVTRTAAEWKGKKPDIQKRPAIFIVQGV
jgi:16S rRNA (cytidine1402-2'-O)-methyltransferase